MDALSRGQDVLFDVDWQGTQQLRENALEDLVSIFILPPSIEELERRLYSRNQDSNNIVKSRMAYAQRIQPLLAFRTFPDLDHALPPRPCAAKR